MKKYILDLKVVGVENPHPDYVVLRMTDTERPLPSMIPGQFVEVRVDHSPNTFLRRPISVNFVDETTNELWLLVHVIGDGTRWMAGLRVGDTVNVILPLGNGFTMEIGATEKMLLIGGGVGTAPLLYMGKLLKEQGVDTTFLLGARSGKDLLQLDEFGKYGRVLCTTEDGTKGEKGFVTQHSVFQKEGFSRIATCGPKPMMVAVSRLAKDKNIACEASLENMMACGVGACLCCVEKTNEGNICVCKEGPVFNVKDLLWLN